MSLTCVKDPVIIAGVPRSGTTLVSQCLRMAGLFLGINVQKDLESLFFFPLNEKILKQANAGWDNPAPLKYLIENSDALRMTAQCLETDLLSPKIRRYLGLRRYMRYRSIEKFDEPWGWKDPRNVLTLPIWLELFPRARVIYIVRNGIDVANSLTVRANERLGRSTMEHGARRRKGAFRSTLQRAGFKGSARCLRLERSFSLWEEYLSRADEILAGSNIHHIIIKFEDLLCQPEKHLSELVKFSGLDEPNETQMHAISSVVNPKRANAFALNENLKSFHEQVRSNFWMRKYGYSSKDKGG